MHGRNRGWASGLAVAVLGAVLLVPCLIHAIFVHVPTMATSADPALLALDIIGLLFLILPSITLVYVGFWISDGGTTLPGTGHGTIPVWCALGSVGIAGVIGAIKFHRFLDTGAVAPATAGLELLSGAGGGAILGLTIGWKNARARRQSERLREQRDAFAFLNMTLRHHVLNTLNIVIGYAEEGRSRLPKQDENVLDPVIHRSESVADLVENVGRIAETYTGEISGRHLNVGSLLEDKVAAFRTEYPYAEFETRLPDDATYVRGDESLRVAFNNVISNAVQHNDRQTPQVVVSVRADDSSVVVRVGDDGPGIPQSERARLVAPPNTGASGFGLYLASEIVDHNRGSMSIEDNDPRGTVVTMTFPRATVTE